VSKKDRYTLISTAKANNASTERAKMMNRAQRKGEREQLNKLTHVRKRRQAKNALAAVSGS
jgi:hypothetical protein